MRRKRTLLTGLVVTGVIAGLEDAARVHDDRSQFRFQLFKALDMMRCLKAPVTASPDSEMRWPAGAVMAPDPRSTARRRVNLMFRAGS